MIVISDIIFEIQNSLRKNHKMPSFVMINPVNKENLKKQLLKMLTIPEAFEITECYGMKIIWTEQVEENKVFFVLINTCNYGF